MTKNIWPALIIGALGIPFLLTSEDPFEKPSNDHAAVNAPPSDSPFQFASHSYHPDRLANPPESQWFSAANQSGNPNFGPNMPWGPEQGAYGFQVRPSVPFAEVFRAGIEPSWVKQRWERISVFSSDHDLTAYRCEFTSGRQAWDIHGALTYFFDPGGQLAKISFRGWTGDAETFKSFAAENWKLRPKGGNSQRVLLQKSWSNTRGALILQEASVIRRENSHENVAVFFEVALPSFRPGISQEMIDAAELVR